MDSRTAVESGNSGEDGFLLLISNKDKTVGGWLFVAGFVGTWHATRGEFQGIFSVLSSHID